jgi:hypothetical protein
VRHLQRLAVAVELARDHPLLADRQQLPRIAPDLTEIDERDPSVGGIGALHPERGARAADLVTDRGHLDGDRPVDIGVVEHVEPDPLDRHHRQMEDEVDRAGQLEPPELARQRRPDSLEGGDLGEQRVE